MIFELLHFPKRLPILIFEVSIFNREPHFHRGMEVLYVLDGEVVISKDDERAALKKGDIYIIEQKKLHRLKQTQGSNSILVLQFDTNFCQSFFPEFSSIRFSTNHIKREESKNAHSLIKDIICELLSCASLEDYGAPFQVMSILNRLCYILVDVVGSYKATNKELETFERGTQRLGRIIDYIHENYMHKITLKEFSERENLNMSYLSNFIKQQLGISFQKYLNYVRTENAAQLLTYTDKRLTDICIECGFSDNRYLIKAFEAHYGMSPQQFRKHPSVVSKSLQYIGDAQHEIVSLEGRIDSILREMQ